MKVEFSLRMLEEERGFKFYYKRKVKLFIIFSIILYNIINKIFVDIISNIFMFFV